MEAFVRNFIRASLVWFGVGITIGLLMAIWPAETLAFRPAHAHAHLLGFVSMMIFGVAYHVIPRFAGSRLTSRRLAAIHFWVAQLGLGSMVAGWVVRLWLRDAGAGLLAVGGVLTAVGAGLFIYNLWTTLGPVRIQASPMGGSGPQGGRAPVAQPVRRERSAAG